MDKKTIDQNAPGGSVFSMLLPHSYDPTLTFHLWSKAKYSSGTEFVWVLRFLKERGIKTYIKAVKNSHSTDVVRSLYYNGFLESAPGNLWTECTLVIFLQGQIWEVYSNTRIIYSFLFIDWKIRFIVLQYCKPWNHAIIWIFHSVCPFVGLLYILARWPIGHKTQVLKWNMTLFVGHAGALKKRPLSLYGWNPGGNPIGKVLVIAKTYKANNVTYVNFFLVNSTARLQINIWQYFILRHVQIIWLLSVMCPIHQYCFQHIMYLHYQKLYGLQKSSK